MSTFFLLNNFHFTLEVLGALTFLTVAWLAFDAFALRRDTVTAIRGIGFSLLALWQIIHAFNFSHDLYNYLGYLVYFLGIVFIISSLAREYFAVRPASPAVLILPNLSGIARLLSAVTSFGLGIITYLAYLQYKKEFKKDLRLFLAGFLFLTAGSLLSIFYRIDLFNSVWILGHILEAIGFFALGWWVWNFLRLRLREQILFVFISATLFMAIIVSLTFSTILVGQITSSTKDNLLTNTKVLDLAISRLKEEALAKAELATFDEDLKEALQDNNFPTLETIASQILTEKQLGFLSILDPNGEVLLRAHALTKRNDNAAGEKAVKAALSGKALAAIEPSPAEGFSIRAAAPVFSGKKLIGVVVAGFQLDNAFADSIKKITGLEMSIFQGRTRVATTTLNPDGRTRSIGIEETDEREQDSVFTKRAGIILFTQILSRPFLASYLPLVDEDKVVGMISAAKAQRELTETTNHTNRLTLVTVIIVMVILSTPIYIITRRLSQE